MRGKADGWIGLGLLVFCGVMYTLSWNLPKAPYGTMGPAYMPNLILGVLAVLSATLMAKGFLASAVRSKEPSLGLKDWILKYRNIVYSFLLFFLFVLLLPVLGYVPTSFAFLLILQVLLGPKRWRLAPVYVGVSLGITLFLFLMFRCMLLVILPESDYEFFRALEDAVYVTTCIPWEHVSSLWH